MTVKHDQDGVTLADGTRGPVFDDLQAGESAFSHRLINGTVTCSSQQLRLSGFVAKRSEPITQLRTCTSSTAAGATPTRVQLCVYELSSDATTYTLVAQTANDTALLSAGTTIYTKALSGTWSKVAGRSYAMGLLVVTSATAPTISATGSLGSHSTSLNLQLPEIGAFLGSQATLPSSFLVSALTAAGNGPWMAALR